MVIIIKDTENEKYLSDNLRAGNKIPQMQSLNTDMININSFLDANTHSQRQHRKSLEPKQESDTNNVSKKAAGFGNDIAGAKPISVV